MIFKLYGVPRISAASGPRAALINFFVPNAALIRVNTYVVINRQIASSCETDHMVEFHIVLTFKI